MTFDLMFWLLIIKQIANLLLISILLQIKWKVLKICYIILRSKEKKININSVDVKFVVLYLLLDLLCDGKKLGKF